MQENPLENVVEIRDCVEPIRPSANHTVLFEWPIVLDERFGGTPAPKQGKQHWGTNFVRLPCSTESKIEWMDEDGKEILLNRWERIQEAYCKTISSSKELEAAILSYNLKYKSRWKFHALHQLFEEELDEEETESFFQQTFPNIVNLAFQLPELIPWAIPLLKQGTNKSISLTQMQAGCLLANAFLCTFPRRNSYQQKHEYSTYPAINFSRLFQSSGACVIEKLKCVCHYFRRITIKDPPSGIITITRRCVLANDFPKWDEVDAFASRAHLTVESTGTIEDATGTLQVDFANKYLGGGVLGHGCVQEEIRFVICPELLVSKLFCECLRPNEAIIVTGVERFSKYTGYASTFKWAGNYSDDTPWDSSRRKQCTIVAIDALEFRQSTHQFKEELMVREMNKAYVGFYHPLNAPPPPVGSGNWGCGAFGGEPLLKALLQLLVCSTINRPLHYFTFGNEELKQDLEKMYEFLKNNQITVSKVWQFLKDFEHRNLSSQDLYSFIYQSFYDKKDKSIIQKVTSPLSKLAKVKQLSVKNFFNKKVAQPTSIFSTAEPELVQSSTEIESNGTVLVEIVNEKPSTFKPIESKEFVPKKVEENPKPSTSSGLSLLSALDADYNLYNPDTSTGDICMEEEEESPPKRQCLD